MIELIKSEDFDARREYYQLLEHAVTHVDVKMREVINGIDNMVVKNGVDVSAL